VLVEKPGLLEKGNKRLGNCWPFPNAEVWLVWLLESDAFTGCTHSSHGTQGAKRKLSPHSVRSFYLLKHSIV
jgi:hypothetical protein